MLPRALRAVVDLPWPVKRWLAREPRRWRLFSGVCRRLGWTASSLGWHTATNGPYRGIHVRATHVNQLWMPMGLYEPEISRWLVRLLREDRWGATGAEVWDIGANVGLVSLLCARHGAPRVLAFEPAAVNLARLRDHCGGNADLTGRIRVVEAAVSDLDGEVRLVSGDAAAEAQIVTAGVELWDHAPGSTSTRVVKTVRLDSVLAETGSGPAILKIDVEGAEALVLAGARGTLARRRPAIVLEVHNRTACRACVALLSEAGYTVRRIVGSELLDVAGEGIAYGHLLATATVRASSARGA